MIIYFIVKEIPGSDSWVIGKCDPDVWDLSPPAVMRRAAGVRVLGPPRTELLLRTQAPAGTDIHKISVTNVR